MSYVPEYEYISLLHQGEVCIPRIKVSETGEVMVFAIEARHKVHIVFESDDFKRKLNESF
ncbi:hypothetical protein [Brevibacillus laterosporus]|uniref:hypothetical protein n=1 Tax=Brevibacillus laterosporus TaxID=1465 RepID=UPI0018CF08A4|nr:hypothetical protein [Brevibacillus laterosporus]MBG9788703.1 hypothetical protein [Brevibacillus laterosporus]